MTRYEGKEMVVDMFHDDYLDAIKYKADLTPGVSKEIDPEYIETVRLIQRDPEYKSPTGNWMTFKAAYDPEFGRMRVQWPPIASATVPSPR